MDNNVYVNNIEKNNSKTKDINDFKIFGAASAIYAIIFVICLYKNTSGITNPIWAVSNIIYMVYIAKRLSGRLTYIIKFMFTIILLLGISNCLTDNSTIIFFNYLCTIAMISVSGIYLLHEEKGLNVISHLGAVLQSLGNTIGYFGIPFRQLKAYFSDSKKEKNGKDTIKYVVIGICVTLPALIIVGQLLAEADEVFAQMMEKVFSILNFENIIFDIFGIVILIVIGFTVPYAYMKYVSVGKYKKVGGENAKGEPIIANIVSGAVVVMYLLFSAIQIYYLFAKQGTLPQSYSYAEYAREGYFQLLVVCLINVAMVICAMELFKKSNVLKVFMTIICACTFIMILSSGYRMSLYISQFGLTFLRVFVIWTLVVISMVMAGVVSQIFQNDFPLFNYCVVVVTLAYVVLSFGRVDNFIAEYDLQKYEQLEQRNNGWEEYMIDYDYIMTLSTDAAPAIIKHKDSVNLFMKEKGYYKQEVNWMRFTTHAGDSEKLSIREINFSRMYAIKHLPGNIEFK